MPQAVFATQPTNTSLIKHYFEFKISIPTPPSVLKGEGVRGERMTFMKRHPLPLHNPPKISTVYKMLIKLLRNGVDKRREMGYIIYAVST